MRAANLPPGHASISRGRGETASSAEIVEGRALPKGNGGQTAAARTLRRDTAANGLAALRRATRQSKTVGSRHCCITSPPLALARDAASGIDGVIWRAYVESLKEKLPFRCHRPFVHGRSAFSSGAPPAICRLLPKKPRRGQRLSTCRIRCVQSDVGMLGLRASMSVRTCLIFGKFARRDHCFIGENRGGRDRRELLFFGQDAEGTLLSRRARLLMTLSRRA